MRILIVDDRPADRFILKVLFETHGCETWEAENGREGLARAAEQRPDLIISDALMPVLDGCGFLREIKAEPPLKGIPKDVLLMIRYHHERMDGTGYPNQIGREAIPLGARIVSVADAYDCMTATKPYRPAPGNAYAISEIRRCSGSHFDPEVVAALIRAVAGEGEGS